MGEYSALLDVAAVVHYLVEEAVLVLVVDSYYNDCCPSWHADNSACSDLRPSVLLHFADDVVVVVVVVAEENLAEALAVAVEMVVLVEVVVASFAVVVAQCLQMLLFAWRAQVAKACSSQLRSKYQV